WNNRPARGAPIADQGEVVADTWVEYDVSALVRGDGQYSFLIVTDEEDGVTFSSREGSRPPQLVLKFRSGGLPTGHRLFLPVLRRLVSS
ncbi:MAG TPA: hypothetical protein VER55_12075, partial [Ardenticatenaceae bacterium]|nr:hypothetical protein [Ardenticatenaceae bacterium]